MCTAHRWRGTPGWCGRSRTRAGERKALLAEKKALPARKIFKHKELAARIAELTEDLEELRSEKALLLQQFEYDQGCRDRNLPQGYCRYGSRAPKAGRDQEQKYSAELDKALEEYAEAKAQAAGLDPVELYEARLAIRPGYEAAANEKLEQAFGRKIFAAAVGGRQTGADTADQ